jgi:hypothetical protein
MPNLSRKKATTADEMDNAKDHYRLQLEQLQSEMLHHGQHPALTFKHRQMAEHRRLLGYPDGATSGVFPPITEAIRPIVPPQFHGATQYADGASEVLREYPGLMSIHPEPQALQFVAGRNLCSLPGKFPDLHSFPLSPIAFGG